MTKGRFVQATAAAVTSVGLVAALSGIAGASAGTATINTTGPNSTNHVRNSQNVSLDMNTRTDLNLAARNAQQAFSGPATTSDNTNGGGATSGTATNSHTLGANLNITNPMPTADMLGGGLGSSTASGTLSNTGPQSDNTIVNRMNTDVRMDTSTRVSVSTDNQQSSASGPATVMDNTNAGNATSGNASNMSDSTFNITIH